MAAKKEITKSKKPLSSKETVESFFRACEALDFDKSMTFVSEKCVYRNMPFHTASGKKNILRDLKLMSIGMRRFNVDMINIVSNDEIVMTERLDTLEGLFYKIDIPLMGILKVEQGQIVEWRDYFDWSSMLGNFGKSILFKRSR